MALYLSWHCTLSISLTEKKLQTTGTQKLTSQKVTETMSQCVHNPIIAPLKLESQRQKNTAAILCIYEMSCVTEFGM